MICRRDWIICLAQVNSFTYNSQNIDQMTRLYWLIFQMSVNTRVYARMNFECIDKLLIDNASNNVHAADH